MPIGGFTKYLKNEGYLGDPNEKGLWRPALASLVTYKFDAPSHGKL